MNDRKYIAISIKHSLCNKSKFPTLWGYKRTADNEKRCFADYTYDINKAELYSFEEFEEKYGNGIIGDFPVKMCIDYKKKYKMFDTVLVDENDLKQYLSML